MWVITKAYNEYDQFGDYLDMVFDHKPTIDELVEIWGCDEEYAEWLLTTGGGRKKIENCWYYLTELKNGEEYTHHNG